VNTSRRTIDIKLITSETDSHLKIRFMVLVTSKF
jgi:hypothetical protein